MNARCRIRNIVLIIETPLRERDYHRFGITILSRYFNVIVLDCTAWLQPAYWQKHAEMRYEFPGYISVADWANFKQNVAAISNESLVIDYLLVGGTEHVEIRKWLRVCKIPRAVVFTGVVPRLNFRGLARVRNLLGRARDALRKIYYGFYRVLSPTKPPGLLADLAILSGYAALRNSRAHAPNKIWAHSFDYDIYLSKRDVVGAGASTAVFLDQNLVYHPDLLITGTIPSTTAEQYFPVLNRFFDDFEKRTGCRVIIAAQPRAQYDGLPNLFGGREIIFGQTAELVRDAEIVFAHYSTSISFPVLWQKPIVLLTTNALHSSWARFPIEGMLNSLKVPLINVDEYRESDIDYMRWKTFSKKRYAQYKKLYIKMPGTSDQPIWEIFAEYVQRHFA